jgi:hypothetical protein
LGENTQIAGHFPQTFDLTQCSIQISFTYDATGIDDDFGSQGKANSYLGVKDASYYSDYYPGGYSIDRNDSKGIWVYTDYDYHINTFEPDEKGDPRFDYDDEIYLDFDRPYIFEGDNNIDYDIPFDSPPLYLGGHKTFYLYHNVRFDRDGVHPQELIEDGYIDGKNVNTGGIYEIVMSINPIDETTGEAFLNINGLDQGYEEGTDRRTVEAAPVGTTFHGDMTNMQVFYGFFADEGDHQIRFSDIAVKGCKEPLKTGKVNGGGHFKVGNVTEHLSINAITNETSTKGKVQYSKTDKKNGKLSVHSDLYCAGFLEGKVIAEGPLKVQNNTLGEDLSEYDWIIVTAEDNGNSDSFNVEFVDSDRHTNNCSSDYDVTNPPIKGNINIKSSI